MSRMVVGVGDLGRWFKLWCAAVHDPDLDNLPIADFGRWAKLGAIVKEQGTGGKITLTGPATSICAAMQVDSFDTLFRCFSKLPNIVVSSETIPCVSFSVEFRNWLKYQENISTERVRRHRAKIRQNETPKKRGEEKRREESKKREKPGTPSGVLGDHDFLESLRHNPAYRVLDLDVELAKMDAWLTTPRGRGKKKTRGRIVAWLNRALEDQPLGDTTSAPSYHELLPTED